MKEYKLKITNLTPETLSITRLAEYMKVLSDLVGKTYAEKLHLKEVAKGSAMPVMAVDDEVAMPFHQSLILIEQGSMTKSQQKASAHMNRLLREDNSEGGLYLGSNRIINFPGVKLQTDEVRLTHFSPITFKGKLYKIGGTDGSVPFGLELPDERILGNLESEALAKEMAQYLYEYIEVSGVGRWEIDKHKIKGKLKDFTVNSFRALGVDGSDFGMLLGLLKSSDQNKWNEFDDPIKEALRQREQ